MTARTIIPAVLCGLCVVGLIVLDLAGVGDAGTRQALQWIAIGCAVAAPSPIPRRTPPAAPDGTVTPGGSDPTTRPPETP